MTRPPSSHARFRARFRSRRRTSRRALGVSLVAGVLLVGGCSQVPDYANPIEWYKSAADAVTGGSGEDAKTPPPPGSDAPFPKLGDVPERPSREAALADLDAVAEGLAADRANAKYTAPPPAPTPTSEPAPPPAPKAQPAPQSAAPAPAAPVAASAQPRQAQAQPQPQPQAPAPAAVPVSAAPPPSTGPVDVKALFSRLFTESGPRAVAPPAGVAPLPPPPAPSSAALSPAPSPLPPASNAPAPSLTPPPLAPLPSVETDATAKVALSGLGGVRGLGDSDRARVAPSAPAAVIHFAVGSSSLNAEAKRALRKAVAIHKKRGGTIRVVGHASSRTREMPLAKHKLVNFEISLKRARAVAKELLRLGVKPENLFVGAVGDNDPVYYEWMPSGEAGNRRTEVFLDF